MMVDIPAGPYMAPHMPNRTAGFGASDVSSLMGMSLYSSPIKAWLRWFGMDNTKQNALMLQGHRLQEEWCLEYLEAHPEVHVCEDGVRTPCPTPVPYCWATPDYICHTSEGPDRETWGLEIKTVGHRQESRWANGAIPKEAEIQCRWCMLASDLDRWDLHAHFLGSGGHVTHTLRRNPSIEGSMIACVMAFKTAYIDTGMPPPPDGSSGYSSAITDAYPMSFPQILETDDDIVRRAFELNEAVKAAEKALSKVKGHVKFIMAASDEMVSPWGRITFKTNRAGSRPLNLYPLKED